MESACQPPSWCQCRYGSSWLCLNLRLIHHKNTLRYVYGDWWFHIDYFDSDKSLYLPHSFACLMMFLAHSDHCDGMCKAKTPVVKEICVTSQWRQVVDVARFLTYFVVNTCNITLFSHGIIGIDHGRSGVTATTPWWFVVRRGRPSSCALETSRRRTTNHSGVVNCALGTSRRRTTNHSGVVAVTPSRPWSIP